MTVPMKPLVKDKPAPRSGDFVFGADTMEKTVFADAMAKVQVINGVVRMDMVQLNNSDGKDANATVAETTAHLMMPLTGFLRMHEQMSNAIEQMIEKGMLKRQEPAKAAPPAKSSAKGG